MKKLWFASIIALLFVAVTPCHASELYEEKSMVYATASEQEAIYQLLQDDSFEYKKILEADSLTIVKESIAPLYTIDLLEYAETGVLNVKPSETGTDGVTTYMAKVITSQQEFAGNLRFHIADNTARGGFFYQADYNSSYQASCSYADHAERIQNCLKEDRFVSAYDVKYVLINFVGEFFYVHNDKHHVLIPAGWVSLSAADPELAGQVDVVLQVDGDELKAIANHQLEEHKAFLREKEQWEKEHPGEVYYAMGVGSASPLISGCSQVNNIQNIAEYLNINSNDAQKPAHKASNDLRNIILYGGIALGICITVTGISVIVYRKKCRRK